MIPADIDTEHFEREWAADLDVLSNLAGNGDRPEILRLVDISFIGTEVAIDDLESIAPEYDFAIQSRSVLEDGNHYLFLERMQTADTNAIRSLRILAIQFEQRFGIESDGWGCVAQTGTTN